MSALPIELTEELMKIGDDVEAILEDVVSDSETMSVFTDKVADNLVFFGKSLALWEDTMFVSLPDGNTPTSEELRELYLDLAAKIQQASHFHEISSAANSVSNSSIDVKRADLITALVSHHHTEGIKLPPVVILEKMAEGYIKRLNNLGNTTKIVKTFWRNKLETLKNLHSIVNNIAISMAVQNKGEQGRGFSSDD